MGQPQLGGVKHDLLTLVRMCQIIGESDKEALALKAASSPDIPMQKLLVDGGFIKESMLRSLEIGQALIEKGIIKETQFCVAMFDEMTVGMSLIESLILRGWLPAGWTAERL